MPMSAWQKQIYVTFAALAKTNYYKLIVGSYNTDDQVFVES